MKNKLKYMTILGIIGIVIVSSIYVYYQGNIANHYSSGDINQNNQTHDNKILVAYFSATGTTQSIASYISQSLDAQLYEIVPQNMYSEADLDYNNSQSRATVEQNDSSVRPAIHQPLKSISEYDIVFIGYPIWHGQAPRILSSFLESYDFSDKIMIPFCTSHSSGIGTSAINLQSLVDKSAKWLEGKRFTGKENLQDIKQWIESLNLNRLTSVFDLSKGKNGKAPTVKLNSGYDMPIVGLGTYSLKNDECINSVVSALKSGYRLIDTAYIYDNEESVGEGIRQSGIPREDVFITTKLYPNQYENAKEAIDEALKRFDVDYIDLILLHHPGDYDVEAYKAMENAVKDGKIRSIGLSNWYIEEMEAFLPQITITPVLVQNEIHPYYQESEVIDYMHKKGIVMEGWYPLGGRGHTKELLNDPTIVDIANTHHRTAAQVILRWNLQKGVIVIPGSSNPDHILENISIFDFELSQEEMDKMNLLNRDEKHDWY